MAAAPATKRRRKLHEAVVTISNQSEGEAQVPNRSVTYRRVGGRLNQTSAADYISESIHAEDSKATDSLPEPSDPPTYDSSRSELDAMSKEEQEAIETPLREWLPFRSSYLDELIRLEGRCGQDLCVGCDVEPGLYKCKDCFGGLLLCRSCLLRNHSLLPLHRILHWTGSYFRPSTLRSLGLEIQLGHHGGSCPIPGELRRDFTVVHTNGVHSVDVRFCGCSSSYGASYPRIQLLRASWLPASLDSPRTATTFDCLQTFHVLTLQSKVSAYDYYLSIAHLSDSIGCSDQKYRYDQFLFSIHIWRHLKSLKRAGRGHDPAGIEATKFGECAVECPACPHPDKNLPEDWRTAPPEKSWLYALWLTIDAGFRLKNKDRKTNTNPALGDGWGHFVPQEPYEAYLREYGDQVEPNICDSNLRAVDHANKKFSSGYRSTGLGAVVCARHGLVRKNGMGDLQKGEKYANMDFMVLFTLINVAIIQLVLSYDIVCQWYRNLKRRIPQFPSWMRIPPSLFVATRYVIPKLHIYGHGSKCQFKFSLNFLKWSARTNGEDIERWWSHVNPVSMSTKEMSPGARHDTLDDHAGAWNFRKITKFGSSLASQFMKAIKMRAKHVALFDRFSKRFSPATIETWTAMIISWEGDTSKPCPYEEPSNGITMATVNKELAEEELAEASRGDIQLHEMSRSTFLRVGLELEEQQRIIAVEAKKKLSAREATGLLEKRNALRCRIERWQEVQSVYMPATVQQRSSPDSYRCPESIPLQLPSSLPMSSQLLLAGDLVEKEKRMRIAQADDALVELRRLLRISMGLSQYKYSQAGFGQRANTRTRSLIQRYWAKVNRCADRYRAARSALVELDPTIDCLIRLQPLEASDIRRPGLNRDDEESEDRHEGVRELSWIWLVQKDSPHDTTEASEDEVNDSLRVEWSKSRARSERWSEEVELVFEEMRRVLSFFDWKAQWWSQQGRLRVEESEEMREGLIAYAERQSQLLSEMGRSFAHQWYPMLVAYGMDPEWPAGYLENQTSEIVHVEQLMAEENDDDDDGLMDGELDDIFN